MSELLSALVLGVVQGLTEFLPVSSSGHLVLFEHYFPIQGDAIAFDLVLHLGTLLPVFGVYWRDLWGIVRDLLWGSGPWLARPGVRLLLLVMVGTIPTGIIGVLFADVFEALFSARLPVGIAFGVTGCVLWATRYIPPGDPARPLPWWKGVVVGLVQGIAITPGISRSGSTIAAGLLLGFDREAAARYSFLLSIPAILGAFVLKARDLSAGEGVSLAPMLVGFCTAAGVGYLALTVLLRLVRRGDFSWFALYLWPLSAFAIWTALVG